MLAAYVQASLPQFCEHRGVLGEQLDVFDQLRGVRRPVDQPVDQVPGRSSAGVGNHRDAATGGSFQRDECASFGDAGQHKCVRTPEECAEVVDEPEFPDAGQTQQFTQTRAVLGHDHAADEQFARGARVPPCAQRVVQPLVRLAPSREDHGERTTRRAREIRGKETGRVVAVGVPHQTVGGDPVLDEGLYDIVGWAQQRACRVVLGVLTLEVAGGSAMGVPAGELDSACGGLLFGQPTSGPAVWAADFAESGNTDAVCCPQRVDAAAGPAVHDVIGVRAGGEFAGGTPVVVAVGTADTDGPVGNPPAPGDHRLDDTGRAVEIRGQARAVHGHRETSIDHASDLVKRCRGDPRSAEGVREGVKDAQRPFPGCGFFARCVFDGHRQTTPPL